MKILFLAVIAAVLILPVVMAQSSVECADNEGKVDEFTKGTVTWLGDYTDNCYDATRLKEYYCDEKGELAFKYFDCDAGCTDGACRGSPIADTPESDELQILDGESPAAITEQSEDIQAEEESSGYIYAFVIVVLIALAAAWYFFRRR